MKKAWVVVAALTVLLGCQTSKKQAQGQEETRGTITLSGAFALYPMVVKWAEEYKDLSPGHNGHIGGRGRQGNC